MVSWNSNDGWEISPFSPAILVLLALFIVFNIYKDKARRKSLRRRSDGAYVWVEWHGGERSSPEDPSQPGGEWDGDCDGDDGD